MQINLVAKDVLWFEGCPCCQNHQYDQTRLHTNKPLRCLLAFSYIEGGLLVVCVFRWRKKMEPEGFVARAHAVSSESKPRPLLAGCCFHRTSVQKLLCFIFLMCLLCSSRVLSSPPVFTAAPRVNSAFTFRGETIKRNIEQCWAPRKVHPVISHSQWLSKLLPLITTC